MELRHFRYFVAVAEELHFGRAATKLLIAQPALSLQIRVLEHELGIKLLVRSTRKVELTKAGAVFYERALSILNAVAATSALAKITAGKEVSKITISTIYPATFGILPKFIQRLGRKFPDMRINIKSDTTDNIIKDLERGNTNIGFVRLVGHVGALKYLSHLQGELLSRSLERQSDRVEQERFPSRTCAHRRSSRSSGRISTYTEKYFHDIFSEHGLTREHRLHLQRYPFDDPAGRGRRGCRLSPRMGRVHAEAELQPEEGERHRYADQPGACLE